MAKLNNVNDELFAKEVLRTKDIGTAFQNLHPEITDHKSALAIARNKISNSSEIRSRISELLDSQQLSLIEANKKLKTLLNAKKPIVVRNELINVEDSTVQLMALDKLYKLHGLLVQKPVQIDNSKNVNIGMIGEVDMGRMSEILKEMSILASRLDLTKNKVVYQQISDT